MIVQETVSFVSNGKIGKKGKIRKKRERGIEWRIKIEISKERSETEGTRQIEQNLNNLVFWL